MHRWTLPLIVVLASCAEKNQDPEGAQALWDEVHAADYRAWDRAPGYDMRRDGFGPHGNKVDIFVNDVIAGALAGGEKLTEWPEGSLVVKDGYNDADPNLVAIMEKREDGWYFAEYEPDGEVLFSGVPKTCTDCHGESNDSLLAFGLPTGM